MNTLGKLAEDCAALYLRDNRYKIIERNFSCKYGEIDIIALRNAKVVCIEVKSSKSRLYDSPALRVSRIKLLKIKASYQIFLSKSPLYREYPYTIDVLAVQLHILRSPEIEHFQDLTESDIQ